MELNLVATATTSATHRTETIRWFIHDLPGLRFDVGTRTASPTMEAHNGKWRLELYPGGKRDESAGFLSFYLAWAGEPVEKPNDGSIHYVLRLVHQSDRAQSKDFGKHLWFVTGNSTGTGFHKFTRRTSLLDESNGYTVDGMVILEADIVKVSGTNSARQLDELSVAPSLAPDMTALLEVRHVLLHTSSTNVTRCACQSAR
jgi:hypothetical protein